MSDMGNGKLNSNQNSEENNIDNNSIAKSKQDLLQEFYSRQKEWWPDATLRDIACIIVMVIPYIFFLIMPMRECMRKDFLGIFMMLEFLFCLGIDFYRSRYGTVEENKKIIEISKIFKYMPISKRDIDLFVLKKVAKRCLKLTIASVTAQCALSIICYHTIEWFVIVIPVVILFVIPVIFAGRGYNLIFDNEK